MKEESRWVDGVNIKNTIVDYKLPAKLHRCLGADDGCALAVMIYMIAHQVPGTYLFVRGEEIGCVGTHYIIDNNLIEWSDYMMAIEVDRKGTKEIIGNMAVGITASQSFVSSLALQLNMGHKMGKGTITDVGHIAAKIPECVNISAGYELQHSDRETTDWVYLDKLSQAMLDVKWDELVVERLAGVYAAPKPAYVKSTYTPSYNGGNTAYMSGRGGNTRNSYDDWTIEPSTQTMKFTEMLGGVGGTGFAKEAYVRSNAGFMVEFLEALNISPLEMHNIVQYGSIHGAAPGDDINLDDIEDIITI
jgi:hypothetical protein